MTIKYGGATVRPEDPRLPELLRKKSEIGKASFSKRQEVTAVKMKRAKELVRDYFDVMDVPGDEDGLVGFMVDREEELRNYISREEETNGALNPEDLKCVEVKTC